MTTRAEAFQRVNGGKAVWRIARLQHRCDALDLTYRAVRCRRLISKGDKYFDTGLVISDTHRTKRYCVECANEQLR